MKNSTETVIDVADWAHEFMGEPPSANNGQSEFVRKIAESTKLKHQYWHAFWLFMQEKFGDNTADWAGDEVLTAVDQYAQEHPEVIVVPVDDDSFSSSSLVLVPHPQMGISALFIPQCTQTQNQFFLYPAHLNALQQTLTKLQDEYQLTDDAFIRSFLPADPEMDRRGTD